ncbi:ferredoxin [Mycobacterium intracellulare]|uniref:ferredoxin n=1 Tax=Mycobacterium intracellulare TaxID=1767 RepID=UPI001EEE37B8|nr:ferredoxin [Mycobacterium intracellulare]MEE3753033.1 ferredoxin [Mycobacterium intracellulare]
MTKLQIDPNRCVGHGQCYLAVPDLIEDDDRGLAHVQGDGYVPPDRLESLQQAQKLCPERAVLLTEDVPDARESSDH